MNGRWKDDIRRMMESHAAPLPDVSWHEVERALHDIDGRSRKPDVENRPVVWSRHIAAVAAVLLILIGIGVVMNDEISREVVVVKRAGVEKNTDETGGLLSHIRAVGDEIRSVDGTLESLPDDVDGRDARHKVETSEQIKSEHEVLAVKPVDVDTVGVEDVQDKDTEYAYSYNVFSKDDRYRSDRHKVVRNKDYSYKDSRLMAGLYMGNSVAGGTMSEMKGNDIVENDYYGGMGSNGIHDSNGSPVGQPVTEVRHHQPVRIGIGVGYRLTGRWSLESGIVYSILRSDIGMEGINHSSYSNQKLHYIGIPLEISYSIWRSKYINLYVSGGGMVEKMVSGKTHTRVSVFGRPDTYSTENVSISPLQLSVGGSLGAGLSLYRRIGLFVEPGVNYYLNNHSSVPTFYNDKPLSFSLSVGLRYDIR